MSKKEPVSKSVAPEKEPVSKRVAPKHVQTEDLAQLYSAYLPPNKNHQVVSARVTEMTTKEVVLDLGLKADTSLPRSQFIDLPDLKVGDFVDVYVVSQENRHGQLVVSRKDAKRIKAWKMIHNAYLEGKILQGKVVGISKGGLDVDVAGALTFMPGSQVDIAPVQDFNAYENEVLELVVLKMNYEKDNVVVSRKAITEKELEHQKKEIIAHLEEGQVLEGVVRNVTSFGAFVDLGGIVGLVYVKHMIWDKRIDHPDKVKDADGNCFFVKDKKIQVVVIGFDEEKTRISLSTRELLPNPWEQLSPEIKEGADITGVVTKILDRSVFVKVEKLVEAFMYIGDLSYSKSIGHPSEVVSLGEEIKVRVLTLDRETQEFRVGIKQAKPDPWSAADFYEKYGLNKQREGIVRRLVSEGAFVELEDGVEGFLHIRHMSWTKKVKYPSQILKKGQKLTFIVLNINEEDKLLELGLRELEDSPWENFESIFVKGTSHEGTLIKMLTKNGFGIVQLPYGLEVKVDLPHLMQADKKPLEEGAVARFKVLNFDKERQKVAVSHTATFDQSLAHQQTARGTSGDMSYVSKPTKTTLGDMKALDDLKKKIEESVAKST